MRSCRDLHDGRPRRRLQRRRSRARERQAPTSYYAKLRHPSSGPTCQARLPRLQPARETCRLSDTRAHIYLALPTSSINAPGSRPTFFPLVSLLLQGGGRPRTLRQRGLSREPCNAGAEHTPSVKVEKTRERKMSSKRQVSRRERRRHVSDKAGQVEAGARA